MRPGRKRTYAQGPKAKSRSRVKRKKYSQKPLNETPAISRPLGNKKRAQFRYCETFQLNPTALGLADIRVFSANGLYDPDITGVGHQPSGFDQVMALFDHYTVVGAKMQVQAVNLTGNEPIVCGIGQRDSTGTFSDHRAYIESGTSVWDVACAGGSGYHTYIEMESGCSIARFLGRPNPLDEDDLRGDTTANPAEQAYFHVWAGPLQAGVDAGVVAVQIIIDYTAVLTEPNMVGLS